MTKLWKKSKQLFRGICIVDRFLLLFMLLLFSYLVYRLFTGTVFANDTNTIDVIIRTSAAAIFGYFMSGNFGREDSTPAVGNNAVPTDPPLLSAGGHVPGQAQNRLGFQITDSQAIEEKGKVSIAENPVVPAGRCSRIQVFVVSSIGLLSLAILMIARNYPETTPELTAMVSQLRDFVSACIGFLISCGKNVSR